MSDTRFTVVPFHLELLKRLNFSWYDGSYDGTASVDLKRPYGDSDTLASLREIYSEAEDYKWIEGDHGGHYETPRGETIPVENLDDELWGRHRELVTVLEILSRNPQGVEPGDYARTDRYSADWERAEGTSSLKPGLFYTIEPHSSWVEEGQVAIEELVERVYGKPFSSLQACRMDKENIGNDSFMVYELEDEDTYEDALHDFDDTELYLGYNRQTGESLTKIGVTSLDYWLSISWVGRNGAEEATVEANPEEGTDLQGAIFPDDFFAQRAYSPSLEGILADLIRRGELPRANYIFKNWW